MTLPSLKLTLATLVGTLAYLGLAILWALRRPAD